VKTSLLAYNLDNDRECRGGKKNRECRGGTEKRGDDRFLNHGVENANDFLHGGGRIVGRRAE